MGPSVGPATVQKKKRLLLPEIEPRFLCRLSRSLVATQALLYRFKIKIKSIYWLNLDCYLQVTTGFHLFTVYLTTLAAAHTT
jgi:hypothetical protein